MLALAAADAVGGVLFGTLYALAGTGHLAQPAFLACLLVIFTLVTALWVRVEGRHRSLDPGRRLARAASGLIVALIAVPMAVLTPLFWLDTQVAAEAGLRPLLAPIMTLVFIALVLTVLANLAGGVVIVTRRALAGRRPGGR